jgi:tetratricopeptide (TPR) repeat protein
MSGDDQVFQNAMNQGHSAAWDEDWDKAASFYHLALDEFPDNPVALTSLALSLYELQRYPEALVYYQKAAKLSPTDPVPMQKVAEINELSGDINKAVRAYMDVAEVYAHSREVEKAIRVWTHVIALAPDQLTAHTRLALVYERLGRNTPAMAEYIAIASLLQHQGETHKAIQTMNHALQVVPNSNEAKQVLSMLQSGILLPKPNRPPGGTTLISAPPASQAESHPAAEDARSRLDPIQDAKQRAMGMLAELLFEQEENQGSQSRKGLSSILTGKGEVGNDQIDPTKVIIHLSQAIDLQSHGQEYQAVVEMERAMAAGLESSAAYFDLGFLQSKNEQYESAVQTLKKAVQHELFRLGTRLLLGLTLYKMDLNKEASIQYLEALRIADSECVSPEYAEELSHLYEPLIESFSLQSDIKMQKRICENISKMLIRPDWREQIQLARQQLPAPPEGSVPVPLAEMLTEASSSQLVESLARVNQLSRANKLGTAMEEAFYALKIAPTYLPLHICIADLLVQENRLPEAVTKFSIISRSYSMRGETNRAISLLRRVSLLAPLNMEARDQLIEMLMTRGKVEDVLQEYYRLAETYYNLADLAMARKTYSRALKYAQHSNADRQTKAKLMHRLADIAMQSLDLRDAIQMYEQIRTNDPDDIEARSMLYDLNLRLGQVNQAVAELDNYLNYLINNHRTSEAMEFINTKIHENQSQPILYRRLAEIYRLLGRRDDAVNQLDIAKEMYIQSGNQTEAVETIRTILTLNPSNAPSYHRMLVELHAE